jgi:uncharacterized membrane protein
MNRAKAVLSSFGLGAGLMFVLDPYSGRRRRALFRDKLAYGHRKIGNTMQTTLRDVKNRTAGLVSGLRFFSQTNKVTDEVLVARIRSKLGRVCSHPSAIEIETNEGHVTLRGPVLADEMKDVLSAVSSVRGVRSTENKLASRQEAGNVSSLQGGRERLGEKPALLQTYWSPTTRLLAGAAGGFLTIYGLRQGGIAGTGMSGLGTAILLRGLTNLEMKRLVGLGAGTRAVDINKTINILAPVERVFEFWRNYQNFPKFMSHVREVRETGDHQSHWVLKGPVSIPLEWDAVITAQEPNELLAWKSQPDSTIQHAGVVRFQPNANGSTTVHIHMSYNPPAGAIGHALATVLGADPKKKMDDDLIRMKTMIEEKTAAYDVAENPLAI